MKLRKNEFVMPNKKDLALFDNPPTLILKDQGLDFFACSFRIIFPNFRQHLLSTKKSEKDALELKIKDITHLANFLNPWPEDTKIGLFLFQFHGFLLFLSNAPKAFALTMALALLLEPKALEPDFSI